MTWIEVGRDIGVFGVAAYIIQRIIDNSSTVPFSTLLTDCMLNKNNASTFLFFTTLLLTIQACSNQKEKKETSKEEWVSLINGKDLTGWDIKIKGPSFK